MSNDTPIKVETWNAYIEKHPKFTGCLIDKDNDKVWCKNGKWHRENGPACELTDGYKAWWLNDKRYTEREHRRLVRQMKMKLIDTMKHSL